MPRKKPKTSHKSPEFDLILHPKASHNGVDFSEFERAFVRALARDCAKAYVAKTRPDTNTTGGDV